MLYGRDDVHGYHKNIIKKEQRQHPVAVRVNGRYYIIYIGLTEKNIGSQLFLVLCSSNIDIVCVVWGFIMLRLLLIEIYITEFYASATGRINSSNKNNITNCFINST